MKHGKCRDCKQVVCCFSVYLPQKTFQQTLLPSSLLQSDLRKLCCYHCQWIAKHKQTKTVLIFLRALLAKKDMQDSPVEPSATLKTGQPKVMYK